MASFVPGIGWASLSFVSSPLLGVVKIKSEPLVFVVIGNLTL